MTITIHLDHELTKQELQIENRYLRNQLATLRNLLVDMDLANIAGGGFHLKLDDLLYRINKAVDEAPNGNQGRAGT